tara:strand:+ start:409 stop:795 length:387 start_codon:yes stop_codon:yes gene_type:complete
MIKSVNQSWSVSPKFRDRYGSTWADMDFFFKDRISAKNFSMDPMNTEIGTLQLAGLQLRFRYKDIISYSKTVNKLVAKSYKADKQETFALDIKTKTIFLNKTEITRLRETLDDALVTSQRSYELGLYL